MDNFTESACILQSRVFKEADLSLKILSKERGLFTVYAFGGAKSRRRFVGCLDIFSISQCTIAPSRYKDYLTLQEATLLRSTGLLRRNPLYYGMAQNCALFIEASCRASSIYVSSIYDTFYELLELLEGKENIQSCITIFFRLKLISLLGYTPHVCSCVVCNKDVEDITLPFFSIERGGVLCHTCSPYTSAVKIRSRDALHLLEYLATTSPAVWNVLPFAHTSIQEALVLIDEFIQFHIGIHWHNGYFAHH